MYYDKHGTVMAAGAEADDVSIISQAEDGGWIKTELYVSIPVYPSITKYYGRQFQASTASKGDEIEDEWHASKILATQ